MKGSRFITILLAIAFFSLVAVSQSMAQNKKPAGEENLPLPVQMESKAVKSLRSGKILLNFNEADIKVVAKLMSELTGKNIVLGNDVKGKITILSSQEIPVSEAWTLFKSALRAYDYDIVNKGSYIKIVQQKVAKSENTRFYSEANVMSEEYLVAIVTLRNADPTQVANALGPFKSEIGVITPYAPSNSILIADDSFNVKRLVKIARHLDNRRQQMIVRTFRLKFAPSSSVFQTVKDVYKPDEKQVLISDYAVNNSIVVMATREQQKDIERLLKELDKKPENKDTRRFRVHYLQNANAGDLAKVLSEMLKEGESAAKKSAPKQSATGEGGSAVNQEVAADITKAEKSFVSTKVSSDEETNSLVMYLTDTEYEEVEKLITRLDTPRKQILVSAIIAEVSLKRLQTTGANWQVLSNQGYGAAFGGGKSLDSIYQTLASGNFIMGGIGKEVKTINVSGTKIQYPNVFALIQFLNEDNDFNLLSAPRVLTLDHKEANMAVGSIIPFATGIKFDANGQPVITYDYKDVGLALKITPHVSHGRFVKMDIEQKIQDVTEYLQQTMGAMGYVVPVISNREIKTNTMVGDAETIIIGGLVSKKTIETVKKVPLLGDIPVLGVAFKNRTKEHTKTTLFVFLTPNIIESPEELIEITEKYQHFIDEKLPTKGERITDPEKEGRILESKEMEH